MATCYHSYFLLSYLEFCRRTVPRLRAPYRGHSLGCIHAVALWVFIYFFNYSKIRSTLGNDKWVGTMILHLYFARRFSTAFLFVTAAFSVLIVLLDFIDQLRRFRGNDVPFGNILHLVTLNVPATLYQMLPLIMVLCSIMLFLSLARLAMDRLTSAPQSAQQPWR